jgi:hypothetical protein
MNIVDRQAIEDLFTRLKDAEAKGGSRDADAEALIAKLVARQPAAAYYLAQTVLVQQWALNAAHDHIEDLERSGAGGGILSAIFGGRGRGARSSAPAPRAPVNPPRGIGFLEGASQTALGVAGGFILADMLSQANFNDSALAASFTPDAPADAGFGGMGGDFGGGDFGGGGDGGGGGE